MPGWPSSSEYGTEEPQHEPLGGPVADYCWQALRGCLRGHCARPTNLQKDRQSAGDPDVRGVFHQKIGAPELLEQERQIGPKIRVRSILQRMSG